MPRADEDESGISILAGWLQGLVQAGLLGVGMALGTVHLYCPHPPNAEVWWVAIAGTLLLLALGAWVDLRRRERPLAMLAPPRVRAVAFVLPLGAVTLVSVSDLFAEFFVCGVLFFAPACWLVLDRILGPLCVILARLRIVHGRRAWVRVAVLTTEPALVAIMPDGTTQRVRSELSITVGEHYARLRGAANGRGGPYRDDDLIEIVESERADARDQRVHELTTGTLALASGLAWLLVIVGPFLGAELSGTAELECWEP